MNSNYGPLVLIVVTMGLAVYAATSAGPDDQGAEQSPGQGAEQATAQSSGQAAPKTADQGTDQKAGQTGAQTPNEGLAQGQESRPSSQGSGTQVAASPSSDADASGAQAAASQTGNDQEGTVKAVWEEVKEAGEETADIFTGDDSGQQSANDGQGPLADIWEELKEAGHQTAQIFVGNEGTDQAGAQNSGQQAQQSRGGATASASQGSGQGESGQRDVKVYTTQGQELGAISAVVIDRANNDVRAIVIGQADAGSSNRVDQKLRDALCGDRAQ